MSRIDNVPHSIEAEESLLGAIMLRPSIMDDLAPTVDPSDFYPSQHQSIYSACLYLYDHGQPIDAVTVKAFLGDEVESDRLMALINATPSISSFRSYAATVIEHSRRRRLIHHFSELTERCYQGMDPDDILGQIDVGGDRLIAPRSVEIEGLSSIRDFMVTQAMEEYNRPWLSPHVMKAMWRVIVIAGEGFGKAVLMRFLAIHAAAGRDPWHPSHRIEPVRCLYVDVENSPQSIMHQFEVANTRDNLVEEAADNLFIWTREGGMNLRERRPQAELEAVLQKTRPQIVCAGPLYQLFERDRNETDEQAAKSFVRVIDGLRRRYGFALMLEHHAPKGTAGHRDLNPFGSSLFLRWPEFGLTMEPIGNPTPDDEQYTMEIGRFRRDREPADWPSTLERGAPMAVTAWQPGWRNGRGTRLRLTWVDGAWHHVDERYQP